MYPSQPVIIFNHGFRNEHSNSIDPNIEQIDRPQNTEQTMRLSEMIRIIDYLAELKKPIGIIYSPYLRCRETVAFITGELIKRGSKQLHIRIDHDWTEQGNLTYSRSSYLPYPVEAIIDEDRRTASGQFNAAFKTSLNLAKENDCAMIIISHSESIVSIMHNDFAEIVHNVPPLSWYIRYADNDISTWCPSIKYVGHKKPIDLDFFLRSASFDSPTHLTIPSTIPSDYVYKPIDDDDDDITRAIRESLIDR